MASKPKASTPIRLDLPSPLIGKLEDWRTGRKIDRQPRWRWVKPLKKRIELDIWARQARLLHTIEVADLYGHAGGLLGLQGALPTHGAAISRDTVTDQAREWKDRAYERSHHKRHHLTGQILDPALAPLHPLQQAAKIQADLVAEAIDLAEGRERAIRAAGAAQRKWRKA